jgi:hypothetical protein
MAWGSGEDLICIAIYPEVLSIDTPCSNNIEKRPYPCWCFLVLIITGKIDSNASLPSFRISFIFEVAVATLIGTSTVDCINQINADGDRKIYNPLTNCISDKNSSRFGCIHVLCTSTLGSTSSTSSSGFLFLRLGLCLLIGNDVTGGRDKADFEVLA